MINNKSEPIITLVFYFWVTWLTIYFFSCFFVYTYYITFYIILTDIYLFSKHIIKNEFISDLTKEYFKKIIILVPILLLQLPISGVLFFYRIHKKWMNMVIVLLFCLVLLLLLIILCYFNFIITLYLISISIIIILIFYYNFFLKILSSYLLNIKAKQYKLVISFLISFILFILFNM